MALDTIPKQEGGKLKAVASGTLPNGKPVVVNSDGTVSVAAETNISQAVGSPTVFESAAINGLRSTYDSNSNRVVLLYEDVGNSSYGTCVVGTVNPANNSVSFGTPVVFQSNGIVANQSSIVFDSNSNKVVVFYGYTDGKAKVGTVDSSDNSITFGSSTQFDNNAPSFCASTFDSNSNKVVVAFRDVGQSNAAVARVGTVSGTSISFGTQATITSAGDHIGCAFDSTSNRIVFAYRDVNNSNKGTARVGNITGTNLAFGTPVVFNSGVSTIYCSVAYDSIANKSVIAYADQANSNYGTTIVATVTALDLSISFGSSVVFTSNFAIFTGDNGIAYDTNAGKVVIGYRDTGNSNYGTAISGTVSGTSISFDSPLVFKTALINAVTTVYDSTSERILIGYKDDTNSNYGTGIVYRTGSLSTNLTAENYIGMSGGAIRTDTSTQALGSAAVFESANANNIGSAYDSANNKVVVAYRDDGDSGKGKAVVGTIDTSNNSISFGTPVEFEAGDTEYVNAVFDADSGKIVISFKDNGNSGYGKAIVGTVSGTSISFGSAANFIAASSNNISSVYDSTNNKVVIMYTTLSSPRDGKAVVGTVSGTSISFGSEASFSGSNEAGLIFSSFDSTSGKVVVAYRQSENSGYAVVGTVSGTSISFGTPVNFNGGTNDVQRVSCAYDSTANRTVIFYRDQSNSSYDTAIVGTVSGTTISFGTKTVVTSQVNNWRAIAHDPNAGTNVLAVSTNYNFKVGTVDASDNSMTFSGATTFEDADARHVSALYDSTGQKIILSYQDTGNSNYGTSKVVSLAAPIVIRGEVADGDTATIDIVGTVSSNQLSLTPGQQYYVQTDGTIDTTPADPSVLAGTAVSATKMVVKA